MPIYELDAKYKIGPLRLGHKIGIEIKTSGLLFELPFDHGFDHLVRIFANGSDGLLIKGNN